MFRRFVKDNRGSTPMWTPFLMLVFFMIGVLLFDVHTLYSRYYEVQDELNRCAAVTLDSNILNAALRDTITDMEYQPVLDALEENLISCGWTRDGSGWVKNEDGRVSCRLNGFSASVSGSNLSLSATVQLPLPWKIAEQISAQFPLELSARILYIQ